MRKRIVVGTWMLIAGSVSIAFPLVAHAQPSAESEISCDAPDALQHALITIPAGGRIIVRSGTCTGNFMLSRDIRIQGSGLDQVTLRAADPAQPVVTVPRGITATISGVTIAGGRVGVLVIGLTRNKGRGLRVTKAEAVIRAVSSITTSATVKADRDTN